MRTPEVERIMREARESGVLHTFEVRTLAAEVERLEKRENELINALDMGQINCDAVYDELREERDDAKQRAEAAEARVKELEAELESIGKALAPIGFIAHWQDVEGLAMFFQYTLKLFPGARIFNDVEEQVKAMREQNARLRALAFELASSLGACAGYIASVRTDRQITQDENVYALQTLEWAEGAVECAQYANAALEAYDKALNGEEAST